MSINVIIRQCRQFVYVLALFLMAAGLVSACQVVTWYPYPDISGEIIEPENNSVWYVNDEVACITDMMDQDSRCAKYTYPPYSESWTYPADELTYTWSATGGS